VNKKCLEVDRSIISEQTDCEYLILYVSLKPITVETFGLSDKESDALFQVVGPTEPEPVTPG